MGKEERGPLTDEAVKALIAPPKRGRCQSDEQACGAPQPGLVQPLAVAIPASLLAANLIFRLIGE